MHGAYAFSLPTASATGDKFREAVVADLHGVFVEKNIGRLQITVHDSMIVQVSHACCQAGEPSLHQFQRHPVGMPFNGVFQRLARHIFHHYPAIIVFVGANVVECDQVGVLQIQTVSHTANLDVEIPPDQFQSDFLARITQRKIYLTKSAATNAAFDRITFPAVSTRSDT